MEHTNIGIIGIGTYLPELRMTSKQISDLSGIPQTVVEEKMGIIEKPIPGSDDHTCAMGVKAAQQAITQAGISPEEIDLVMYIGEEYKEYPVWTAGIKMQQELGATKAWAFDTALRCGTAILGIKLAQNLMLSDPSLKTVLLAGGYRNCDLIDYSNPRTRFMYNLSAGGGAVLLRKGASHNKVLGSAIITDGSFSEDVIVPTGGTKQPFSSSSWRENSFTLDVPDPAGMKERLEQKSMQNFRKVIDLALEQSNLTVQDIDYLAILHMKRSAHVGVCQDLGIREDQTIYLEHYGHLGQFDPILSLELGLKEGKIKNGDHVVLVSAGIGYAWGATVVQWGEVE